MFPVPLCDVAQINLKKALDAVEQLPGPEVTVGIKGAMGWQGNIASRRCPPCPVKKKETAVSCHLLHRTPNLLWLTKSLRVKHYVRVPNTEALRLANTFPKIPCGLFLLYHWWKLIFNASQHSDTLSLTCLTIWTDPDPSMQTE